MSSVWTPASSFVASIEQSKGLHGHDAPSMGLFEKYIILKLHHKFLAPPKRALCGGAFFGQAPLGCHKTAPRAFFLLITGIIFCSTNWEFEWASRPRRTFYGSLNKNTDF